MEWIHLGIQIIILIGVVYLSVWHRKLKTLKALSEYSEKVHTAARHLFDPETLKNVVDLSFSRLVDSEATRW